MTSFVAFVQITAVVTAALLAWICLASARKTRTDGSDERRKTASHQFLECPQQRLGLVHASDSVGQLLGLE